MKSLRKKTTATLLIAMFVVSTIVLGVVALPGQITGAYLVERPIDGTVTAEWVAELEGRTNVIHLKVIQGTDKDGDEARIHIDLEAGTTLGDIHTISWDVYLVEGYQPHVDILLDTDESGEADNCLTAEYAYVNDNDITNPKMNQWVSTFEDASGVIPADFPIGGGSVSEVTVVSGETPVWQNDREQAALEHRLSDYQTESGQYGINEDTLVLALEIEIDDWAFVLDPADAECYVDNILVNGQVATDIVVKIEPPVLVVAIFVDKTSINFGTLEPGADATDKIVVSNIGTVDVTVRYEFTGTNADWYSAALVIDGTYVSIDKGSTGDADLVLTVPTDALGTYTASLVFEATAVPP